MRSPILGFRYFGVPSIYVYTLCRMITEFDVVTHVGRSAYLWGQPCLPSQYSGVPALPKFGGCPLTQNDQIWLGNIYGEGRVKTRPSPCYHAKFVRSALKDNPQNHLGKGQPRHCVICVVRFVSGR